MEEKEIKRHKILRDCYRNYDAFHDFVERTGQDIIEYKGITLSFHDLKRTLEQTRLAPRKKQAFYLNVIEDMKQKDVAEIMKITTVSVGQYVDQACLQLAEEYFKGDDPSF